MQASARQTRSTLPSHLPSRRLSSLASLVFALAMLGAVQGAGQGQRPQRPPLTGSARIDVPADDNAPAQGPRDRDAILAQYQQGIGLFQQALDYINKAMQTRSLVETPEWKGLNGKVDRAVGLYESLQECVCPVSGAMTGLAHWWNIRNDRRYSEAQRNDAVHGAAMAIAETTACLAKAKQEAPMQAGVMAQIEAATQPSGRTPPRRTARNPGQAPDQFICTLKDLASAIMARYQTGKPIAVAWLRDQPDTVLVLISGTEFAWNQSTNIVDDIAAYRENPAMRSTYNRNVLAALQAYGVRPGTRIILAGHSLGGMVAQNVAASRDFAEAGYRAERIITFGSPQTAAPLPSTPYVRVEATGDPVPRLGPLELQVHPHIEVQSTSLNPIANHLAYGELAQLATYDVAGRPVADFRQGSAVDPVTHRPFTRECFYVDRGSLRAFASPF